VLCYGNFTADVSHWHDDVFRARLRSRRLPEEQDWWLTFTVADGVAGNVNIDSEHDVQGDFVRIDARH
jgi:hypothetical protein